MLGLTMSNPSEDRPIAQSLEELFTMLEALLKTPHAGAELSDKGINTSLALVAVQGLRAYVRGDAMQAADDLGTVAEEIRTRLSFS